MGLIDELRRRQDADNTSDAEFAARLGVDRTYWLRIRAGQYRGGGKFLRGVLRAYPDLLPAIAESLGAATPAVGTVDHGPARPPRVPIVGSA